MRLRVHVAVALIVAAAAGCRRGQSTPSPSGSALPTSGSAAPAGPGSAAASAQAKAPERPLHPAEQVLMAWNSALDRHDPDRLASLYGPRVMFYGVSKSSEDVVRAKRAAFSRMPDYRQHIENVHIAKGAKGFVLRFDKYSSPKLDAKVAARLVLESTDSGLLIVEETDADTDKRLRKPEPPTCSDAALSAVAGHPVVQSDIKRVAREYRDVHPAGLVYVEEAGKVEAAWGYMHPGRFEPRWWIDVVG